MKPQSLLETSFNLFGKWWARVDSILIRLYSAALRVIVRLRRMSPFAHFPLWKMVGQSGLEPPTSRLSVVCSSQLSYWPSSSQMLFNTCAFLWWRLAGSLFCGKATAVATCHRHVAKSRLSIPLPRTFMALCF